MGAQAVKSRLGTPLARFLGRGRLGACWPLWCMGGVASRRNVVMGLEIPGIACEIVEVLDFAPRIALGKSSAHSNHLYRAPQVA